MKRILLTVVISVLVTIIAIIGLAYWLETRSVNLTSERNAVFSKFVQELESKDYAAAERTLLDALTDKAFADPFAQFDLHNLLADLHQRYTGNESAAAQNYLAALADISEEKSREAMERSADLNRQLGILEDNRGNFSEAMKHFMAALEAVQALQLPDDETSLHESIGIVHTHLKDFERAEFYLEKARKRIESAQPVNLNRLAFINNNLASTIRKRGQPNRALPSAVKAVQIVDLSNDINLKAATYDTIASIYADLGQYDEALQFIEKALTLEVDAEFISAFLQETHGAVLSRLDRKAEACVSWKKSFDLYVRTENKTKREEVRQHLAAGRC